MQNKTAKRANKLTVSRSVMKLHFNHFPPEKWLFHCGLIITGVFSFHSFHLFICLRRFIYGQHEADVDLRPINNNTMSKDQTTTPGTPRPTLFDKCVGSLTSPASLFLAYTYYLVLFVQANWKFKRRYMMWG